MNTKPTYLGVDVSTSKIGIALIDEDKKVIVSEVIKLKPENSLEERAILFENKLLKLNKYYYISEIFVEEPFVAFGGGKTTAQTMAILQRFNGMCSFVVRKVFDRDPQMVSVRSARTKLGIKITRGLKEKETKKIIIEWAAEQYPDFKYELTTHGNPLPGTDDRADALVIATYGLEKLFSV
jgi:RNase H-fold protein (predicted Holliday junction resolvase)